MSAATLFNLYDEIGHRCMIRSFVVARIRRRIVQETIPQVCGTRHALRQAWPELLDQLDRTVAALDMLNDAQQALCRRISDDLAALAPHIHALQAASARSVAIRDRVDDLIQIAREDLDQLKEAEDMCDRCFEWLTAFAAEVRAMSRGARADVQ